MQVCLPRMSSAAWGWAEPLPWSREQRQLATSKGPVPVQLLRVVPLQCQFGSCVCTCLEALAVQIVQPATGSMRCWSRSRSGVRLHAARGIVWPQRLTGGSTAARSSCARLMLWPLAVSPWGSCATEQPVAGHSLVKPAAAGSAALRAHGAVAACVAVGGCRP